MTLQDKKTHLLDNDDSQSNDSDALDLFDQYGGGDDDVTTATASATSTQSVTRPRTDDAVEPSIQESEKKWEQEYEEVSTQKTQLQKEPEAILKVENNASTSPTKEVEMPVVPNAPTQKPVEEKASKKSSPILAVPPVKQNYNSVVQRTDKKSKESKKEFVTQGVETVYEASATQQGVKTKKEQAIKQSYTQEKTKAPRRELHIDPGKKTIMIVDDDIDTMEMYADVFESADYNVIRAADGLEAMSVVAEHTPHVIFTGIVMPRMDGFSMMEALKQSNRTADIPVVINSHLGRDTDKDKAEELGARDFIIRGFTQPREVVERIGALLLKSEYVFHFNKNDKDARKLAKDLGAPNFFHCPRGQEMVIKLNVTDEKELTFSARFSCMDSKDDKK